MDGSLFFIIGRTPESLIFAYSYIILNITACTLSGEQLFTSLNVELTIISEPPLPLLQRAHEWQKNLLTANSVFTVSKWSELSLSHQRLLDAPHNQVAHIQQLCEPVPALSMQYVIYSCIINAQYYCCFTNEAQEAQRRQITCPRSHGLDIAEPGFKARSAPF